MSDTKMTEQLHKQECCRTGKYFASKKYLLREIAGENILVSVGDGVADFRGIITLNQSAAVIWKALQQGATKTELKEQLMTAFSVSEQIAEADIEKVLIMLQGRGMVTYEA